MRSVFITLSALNGLSSPSAVRLISCLSYSSLIACRPQRVIAGQIELLEATIERCVGKLGRGAGRTIFSGVR